MQQEPEQKQYLDNDFFIPDGKPLFRIKQTTLATLRIPSCILPYPSNKVTINDLLRIFTEAYNIKSGLVDGKAVMLGMEGVGKLPLEMHVFELKSKLNNVNAKLLEFEPFLTDKQAFRYECFTDLNFSQSSDYLSPNQAGGKIEICIQLPQIYQEYYYQMAATGTLQEEVAKALKQNEKRIGSDLSGKHYKAQCPVCQEQANLKAKIYTLFHTHQQIELRFDHLKRPKPKELTKVKLDIMEGTERWIKTVSFSSVARKKVRTVLQECKVENADRLSLRVMGVVLKPGDFFSRVEAQAVVMAQGRVSATILEESELFYTVGMQLLQRNFDLQEVAAAFNSVAVRQSKEIVINEIYVKREQRIAEIEQLEQSRRKTKLHRESSFIDPILGYTSPLFYSELNQCLRDTNFSSISQNSYDRVQYKFSFAIVRSLLMLPGYAGKSFRGARFRDLMMKQGEVVCIKSFVSSSINPEKAKQFAKAKDFGMSTYYTIYSLTGREISEFSYYKDEAEVLFMPFTYFLVTEFKSKEEGIQITLQEIPMPRRNNSNLLMWVDDNPAEGSKIHQHFLLNYPAITTEVIQLISNQQLRLWLKKFGHIAKERSKVCLITDLKRGEQVDGGVDTIRMMRRLMGDSLNTFVYVSELQASKSLLIEKNLLSDSMTIGNKRPEVVQFITEKVVEKEELLNDTCQLI